MLIGSRLILPIICQLMVLQFVRPVWADSSRLWSIVHDQCVAGQRMLRDPKPCSEVNLANGEENGYALLQDLFGRTHYLLIPTRRVYGIESPELLLPDSPNYWQAAWLAKKYIASQFGQILPRNKVGMSINSAMQRSQDQLHIHIDCIQPEVL